MSIFEPNAFSTDWAGASAFHAEPIEAYEPVRKAFVEPRPRTYSVNRRRPLQRYFS
ncbi:hypothetical protein [Dyadobacter frigoris]|uniref:hypothetical protein n=1 Tax=Dyadobacter frigoris TaxID=2576211 RepID=UPI001E6464C5|nr:hypothetical protein [Dyadobacter frigoris]